MSTWAGLLSGEAEISTLVDVPIALGLCGVTVTTIDSVDHGSNSGVT